MYILQSFVAGRRLTRQNWRMQGGRENARTFGKIIPAAELKGRHRSELAQNTAIDDDYSGSRRPKSSMQQHTSIISSTADSWLRVDEDIEGFQTSHYDSFISSLQHGPYRCA